MTISLFHYSLKIAAVMVGKKSGVGFQLKHIMNPGMINIHCQNHRLALAAMETFQDIKLFQNVDELIKVIYKYFKYSGVRSHAFAEIQKLVMDKP